MSDQDATAAVATPEDAAPEIVSAFPLPPAFFVLYQDGVDAGPPPPAPMEPQYHMFGTPFSTQDVVPDLLPLPGQKLYLQAEATKAAAVGGSKGGAAAADSEGGAVAAAASAGGEATSSGAGVAAAADAAAIDFKQQMKKINHSLVANFMEMVDVLIKNPALFNEKLSDLELLFLNMHNLINSFRPHQARETIVHMLQMQIQERRDASHDLRKTIDDARRKVEEVHSELHDHSFDEPRSQDAADIKMEDDDQDLVVAGGAVSSAAANTSASATMDAGLGQGELSEKAREAQLMQESFFTSLQALAGVMQ